MENDVPELQYLESVCTLFNTVGQKMDTARVQGYMKQYFSKMAKLARNKSLPARNRFMLQDVIELRTQRNWEPRRKVEKTILTKGGSKQVPKKKDVRKETKATIKEFLHTKDLNEAVECIKELAPLEDKRGVDCADVLLSAVLESTNSKPDHPKMLGQFAKRLVEEKFLQKPQIKKALDDINEFMSDIKIDFPLCEKFFATFLTEFVAKADEEITVDNWI